MQPILTRGSNASYEALATDNRPSVMTAEHKVELLIKIFVP